MIGAVIGSALVLPTPRALLPPFSRQDPVADLRTACAEALAELLVEPAEVRVVAAPVGAGDRTRGVEVPLGHRVARHLLAEVGYVGAPTLLETWSAAAKNLRPADGVLLVMGDGTARRHEKAPGHLHPDAVGFDDAVQAALETGDAAALLRLDARLAAELWCEGLPALQALGEVARDRAVEARLTYADAPYGVAWWVARWDLA